MLTANNILSLNVLLNCVPYNKLRFIILKLEIKLAPTIIKSAINKTLYIRIKSRVLNTKYKELIYKEI